MHKRLSVSLCFAILAVVSSWSASRAQTSDVTLKVGVFGGPFSDLARTYTGDRLKRMTGITTDLIQGNPTDFVAQLIANKGRQAPYDVVYLDEVAQASAISAGVLAKPDPTLVPNLKVLYPTAQHSEGFGPDLLYFSIGIVYNKRKFKEAGIANPVSWKDLWNSKLAGHISVPDISLGQGAAFVIEMARLNGGNEDNLQPGLERIAQLTAHSYYTSSSTLAEQLSAGDVWVSVITSMRAWALADKDPSIAYVIPSEGAVAGRDTIELVAGSEHPKEAQMYINLALDPISQLGFALELSTGPSNARMQEVLADYPELAKRFPASLEDLKNLYMPDAVLFMKNRKKAFDYWNRSVKH